MSFVQTAASNIGKAMTSSKGLGLLQFGTDIAGTLLKAKGQRDEYGGAAAAYGFNANASEEQAMLIEQAAGLRSERARKEAAAFMGTQRAGFAKNGVMLSGSALEVLADSAANLELDILSDEFDDKIRARRLRSEADASRAMAATYSSASRRTPFLTLLEKGTSYATNALMKKAAMGTK